MTSYMYFTLSFCSRSQKPTLFYLVRLSPVSCSAVRNVKSIQDLLHRHLHPPPYYLLQVRALPYRQFNIRLPPAYLPRYLRQFRYRRPCQLPEISLHKHSNKWCCRTVAVVQQQEITMGSKTEVSKQQNCLPFLTSNIFQFHFHLIF